MDGQSDPSGHSLWVMAEMMFGRTDASAFVFLFEKKEEALRLHVYALPSPVNKLSDLGLFLFGTLPSK